MKISHFGQAMLRAERPQSFHGFFSLALRVERFSADNRLASMGAGWAVAIIKLSHGYDYQAGEKRALPAATMARRKAFGGRAFLNIGGDEPDRRHRREARRTNTKLMFA
jgi:hypothetical protein